MFAYKKLNPLVLGFIAVLMIPTTPVQSQTKVYLLAGQSNMVGWADNSGLPPELQQPRADIPTYWQGIWQDLQPGFGGNSSKFGPEITFGWDLADAHTGENIVLIKYAVSGTNLWNDWRPVDGPQYLNFMNAVNGALLSINDPEIVGMVWMQGESDAYPPHSTLAYAQAYEQNLTDFIQSVRSDLNVPDMPFVIGQISEAPVWTWGDIVRQAQVNVSQTVPNTALVITSDLGILTDGMHYDSAATMTLGSRFATAMGGLEFYTNSSAASGSGMTLSWPHTITSDNDLLLVVAIAGEDNDPCDLVISSVTYNDVNMNLVDGASQLVYDTPIYMKTELYYLLDSNLPPSGSYTVEVTYSGDVSSICAGAIILENVEQQAAEAVATSSNEDANTISTDITIQTDGAWVVDVVSSGQQGAFTVNDGNSQVKWFDISGDDNTGAGSTRLVNSEGSTTMSWSYSSGASLLAHSVAAFATTSCIISGHILGPDETPVDGVWVSADDGGGERGPTSLLRFRSLGLVSVAA